MPVLPEVKMKGFALLSAAGQGAAVGSKLKCPLFVASEMSGFRVVPSPFGLG